MNQTRTDKMQAGLAEYQRKLKAGEVVRLDPLQKAAANPTSLRLAVNAKCFDCNGQENWRNRTKYCHITDCPLWNIRPGGKGITAEQCMGWQEPGTY